MTTPIVAALLATMVATSFLSGIFGMAGGMILIGVLLAILSVPEAMALHAITQMASNGWRGMLWLKYVRWHAAIYFLAGSAAAFAVWAVWRYVPSRAVTLMLLGLAPFLVRALPVRLKPDAERPLDGALVGFASMIMMLLSGVSGPLIDTHFLSSSFERREIVATKAICQVCCHAAKLAYFGGLVAGAATLDPLLAAAAIVATIFGNSLARPVLERLTDVQYRRWATRIITVIAALYVLQGLYEMLRGAA